MILNRNDSEMLPACFRVICFLYLHHGNKLEFNNYRHGCSKKYGGR